MSEFSRPVRLDRLSAEPTALALAASEAERVALARRFGLLALDRLEAEARLVRNGEIVRAEGRLHGHVMQSCVATGEPVGEAVESAFALAFYPESMETAAEERELSEAELDTLFYAGESIDLGEAIAETLVLALDPFPRSPNADEALRAAGAKREDEVGPFGALAGLNAKLEGR